MPNKIHIDIKDESDFIQTYNENKVSTNLIDYIIEQTTVIRKKEQIQIVVNKKCEIQRNCKEMIINGLKEELNKSRRQRKKNNIKQICLLILGITFLFLSTLVSEDGIWKEILIITGWVPIWETIEVELFQDVAGRKKRKIIKKLLKCEIIEKSDRNEKYLVTQK